jgi:hypothetical protein
VFFCSDIVPFRSGYHALLGRIAFARFNAVPHYAYLKLKMPGPHGIITINGNTETSLWTEEQTAAFAAHFQAAEKAARRTARQALPSSSKRVHIVTSTPGQTRVNPK